MLSREARQNLKSLWDMLVEAVGWVVLIAVLLFIAYLLMGIQEFFFGSDGPPAYCVEDPALCERQGWP